MPYIFRPRLFLGAAALALSLGACASVQVALAEAPTAPSSEAGMAADFQRDRQSILAMAGDYKVTFDFIETVSFDADYGVMPPKISGAQEVVRVIEDRGDFISLQHILVATHGGDTFPIKHWRQDWQYEPARVLVFIGGNAWEWRDLYAAERQGKCPRRSIRWMMRRGTALWRPGRTSWARRPGRRGMNGVPCRAGR